MKDYLKRLFAPKFTLSDFKKPDYLVNAKRSPAWGIIRKQFIEESGGKCAACGLRTNLEVHHIIPIHIRPDSELDKNNLIVLCENKSLFCHFVIGHSFSWRAYNIHVIEDVRQLTNRRKERLYK